jgi:hypothetical protein
MPDNWRTITEEEFLALTPLEQWNLFLLCRQAESRERGRNALC